MSHKITSIISENKFPIHISRLLTHWIGTAGERLYSTDDLLATQHRWEITERWGGLGRSYGDPRFGNLNPCLDCHGEGIVTAAPCTSCGGTGRLSSTAPDKRGRRP
jgi:hypothetical protein